MMKYCKRMCPYSLWEIDAIEGWLDDMAKRGYLLEKHKNNRFAIAAVPICDPPRYP